MSVNGAYLHFAPAINWATVRELPDPQAAVMMTERLRFLDASERLTFIEKGLILQYVEDRKLWRFVIDPQTGEPCKSMNRWIRYVAPWSHRLCHYAKSTVRQLSDIPVEDLTKIPKDNVPLLLQLSTGVRAQPDVIEDAKTLSEKEFRAKIAVTLPDQHIEAQSKLEQALELAMRLEGLTSRRAAEDVVAEFYLAEHSDEG